MTAKEILLKIAKVYEWVEKIILIILFVWILLIYPAEKEACEKCDKLLLCRTGQLKGVQCEQFDYNITGLPFGNDTLANVSVAPMGR